MAFKHSAFGPLTGGLPRDQDGSTPGRSVRTPVLVGLLLLNALMIAICTVLLAASYRSYLAFAQTEAFNDVRLASQAADATFDKAAIALGAVTVQVERQLAGGGLDTASLWAIVDSQTSQVAEIQRIGLFDSHGAQLCGVPPDRCQRLDVSDRDYFQRLRDHPDDPTRLYGPVKSRPDGSLALILARALRSPDGRFAGVAIAVIPVERLRPLVSAANVGPGGSVTLRRAEDLAPILRQPEVVGADAEAAAQRVSDTLRAAISAVPAEGAYIAVAPVDGVERLAVYRRLSRYPVYILEGRATAHILEAWWIKVAWACAYLLLFAAISLLLWRAIAQSQRRQARALQLYDEAPCGYHTLGPDGIYRTINATELAWLGCTREEVVGRMKPTDFLTEASRATFAANFPEFVRTGVLEPLELDLIARDGRARRVMIQAHAVRDAAGNFAFSNSVVHDITELHAAQAKLKASLELQGVMLDNDLIGMVRVKDRRLLWKNRAVDRIFGYSGSDWDELPTRALYPDDAAYLRVGEEIRAALAEGRPHRMQLPMRHKDGRTLWIDASGALLPGTSGEVLTMVADITPLKDAEERRLRTVALEAHNIQLRETNRLKSELLANMSHELRTPLNAILGFGQMLEQGMVKPESPKFATYIGKIVGSGQHLLKMIDQVLDYARVESGKMEFNGEPVSVAAALSDVVEMLQGQSHARRITVRVQVDDSIGTIVTDPIRLTQMLFALVSNAIKFSNEDGSVEVQARVVDAQSWQVEVTDQGIGIAEANLPRLFMPFVQLSSGSTKTHGGTGIGLALVRLIAVAQGGRIEVRSQAGQGSTFTLTLPRVLDSSIFGN